MDKVSNKPGDGVMASPAHRWPTYTLVALALTVRFIEGDVQNPIKFYRSTNYKNVKS